MDLWPITIAARRSLLATFEELDDDQWAVPTLCDAWSVRDMIGHLIVAMRPPGLRFVKATVRARGDFNKANDAIARETGDQPVPALLAAYRANLEHRFAPPGWPQAAPLGDILLHTLDVRIPLGLPTEQPAADYQPAIELTLGRTGKGFAIPGRPALRWVGTDHEWTSGTGPEVRGAMADLALTAAGRRARLDDLEGDGVDALDRWLA